ncbi:MAG: phage tail fiber protein [Anaerolineae bacterium]
MAGSKSDYLENELLDHVLGGADYTRPATVYVALFTVAPSDTGGGTEVTGGSYARAEVTNNATNWPAASGGVKSNGVDITFPEATADWGTVVAFAIFDAATAGNMLYWGDLTASKTINSGDTAKFNAGELSITED